MLKCGECPAVVDREAGTVFCSVTGQLTADEKPCHLPVARLVALVDSLSGELAARMLTEPVPRLVGGELLCGPGGTRPTDDAEADAVE